MTLVDYCTEDLQYVDPSTSIKDVAQLMIDHDCGSILIGENDKLTGIITDRDITLRCVAKALDPETTSVSECMSPEILYCYDDDEPEEVLKNMADNAVRRLPVLNRDKKLVGIASLGDMARACDHKKVAGEAMKDIRKAA